MSMFNRFKVSQESLCITPRSNTLVLLTICAVSIAITVSSKAAIMPGSQEPLLSPQLAPNQNTVRESTRSGSEVLWRGQLLTDLTVNWWRWYLSIPAAIAPGADPNGVNCGINQAGPVWYLAEPAPNWACTVPAGKLIVAQVSAILEDYPCPASFNFQPPPGESLQSYLQQNALPYIDPLPHVTATLDGHALQVQLVQTPVFSFTAAADQKLADPCITGSPQLGVSYGYWVFIEPLPHGQHVLYTANGAIPNVAPASSATVTLTIQ